MQNKAIRRLHQAAKQFAFTIAIILGGSFVLLPHSLAAPQTDWQQIETPHFRILFDPAHNQKADENKKGENDNKETDATKYAKRVAISAEAAWQTLTPYLKTWPGKTTILIDDSGDTANGAATGFPYPLIILFPAAPQPGDTIADSGPWVYELVLHEYAHILSFEPSHGIFRLGRSLFGSLSRPNLLLPRWYLEGLAVEIETRFSPSGGRLRSPNFLSIPRAMAIDGVLQNEDIAKIGDVTHPEWPGGARPYLMGGLIWNYLARENISFVEDLIENYAYRIPFLIETPIKKRTGKTWQELLDSIYAQLEVKVAHQTEQICAGGSVTCLNGRAFGEKSSYTRSPVFSPSGSSLAYIAREHNHDSVVWIVNRASTDPVYSAKDARRVAEPTSSNRVAWLPDSSGIVYDAIDSVGRYESRTDLWHYDISKKKVERLTTGLRAREPAISPDGQLIAFIQLVPGRTILKIAKLDRSTNPEENGKLLFERGSIKTLYQTPDESRLSWPEFLNNQTLVFTMRTPDGHDNLHGLSFDPDKLETSTDFKIEAGGDANFPRVAGQSLLFASTRNGINNLYQAEVENIPAQIRLKNIRPLTNSTTRAWVGDLDPITGDLIYSRLSGTGSQLSVLTKIDREVMPGTTNGTLAKIDPLLDLPEVDFVIPHPEIAAEKLDATDVSYWHYWIPQYWMPYMTFVPGGAYLSASTSVGDPMGRHSVIAALSSDTRHMKPNLFAAYSNYTTSIRYTGYFDDFWQRLLSSGVDRRTTTMNLSGSFFIPGLSNNWRAEFSVHHQRAELPSASAGSTTLNQKDVRIHGGPGASILWQDLSQKGYEIAPESGGSFKFSHASYLSLFGNQVYDKTDLAASTNLSQVSAPFWLGWLPQRHVLTLTMNVSWLPRLDRLLLAPSSLSLPIETTALSQASTSFIMRGYPTGTFLARKFLRTSAEYKFPLRSIYSGFGTWPAFQRRLHGAVFIDAMTAEGVFYDAHHATYHRSEIGDVYGAAGIELRLDTTLFYSMPVQFIFGAHYGFDARANPSSVYPVLSIAL